MEIRTKCSWSLRFSKLSPRAKDKTVVSRRREEREGEWKKKERLLFPSSCPRARCVCNARATSRTARRGAARRLHAPSGLFRFFSRSVSGKQPHVHATKARARAYTRDRASGERREMRRRKAATARRGEEKWKIGEDRVVKVEKDGSTRPRRTHAFRAARLPGVAEIIDEPRLGRACATTVRMRDEGVNGCAGRGD